MATKKAATGPAKKRAATKKAAAEPAAQDISEGLNIRADQRPSIRFPEGLILLGPPPEGVTWEEVQWLPQGEPHARGQEYWCRWSAYVDASTIAAKLDTWAPHGLWRDHYHEVTVAGTTALECVIEVWNGLEWIGRSDVGVPSSYEKAKGNYSDAFKRTGSIKWGICRDIRKYPTVKAPCQTYVRSKDNKRMISGVARDTTQVIRDTLTEMGFTFAEGQQVVAYDVDGDAGLSEDQEFRREYEQAKAAEPAPSQSDSEPVSEDPAPETAAEPPPAQERPAGTTSREVVEQLLGRLRGKFVKDAKLTLEEEGLWPIASIEGADRLEVAAGIIGSFLTSQQAE